MPWIFSPRYIELYVPYAHDIRPKYISGQIIIRLRSAALDTKKNLRYKKTRSRAAVPGQTRQAHFVRATWRGVSCASGSITRGQSCVCRCDAYQSRQQSVAMAIDQVAPRESSIELADILERIARLKVRLSSQSAIETVARPGSIAIGRYRGCRPNVACQCDRVSRSVDPVRSMRRWVDGDEPKIQTLLGYSASLDTFLHS